MFPTVHHSGVTSSLHNMSRAGRCARRIRVSGVQQALVISPDFLAFHRGLGGVKAALACLGIGLSMLLQLRDTLPRGDCAEQGSSGFQLPLPSHDRYVPDNLGPCPSLYVGFQATELVCWRSLPKVFDTITRPQSNNPDGWTTMTSPWQVRLKEISAD